MNLPCGRRISIGYLNTRGMNGAKRRSVEKDLQGLFDILFIAEDWHMCPNEVREMPWYLAHSILVPTRKGIRASGGILALIRPELRGLVSQTIEEVHSVTIVVASYPIQAVYLPPSMKSEEVLYTLTSYNSKPAVLIGDVNAGWGGIGPTDRVDSIEKAISMAGIRRVVPEPGNKTKWDHAFTDPILSPIVHMTPVEEIPFKTDHPMIRLSVLHPEDLPTRVAAPRGRNGKCYRYFLGKLKRKEVADQLREVFGYLEDSIQRCLNNIWRDLATPELQNTETRQELIDFFDEVLTKGIQESCQSVLGQYEVNAMKQSGVDALKDGMENCTTMAEAVKAYKRLFQASMPKNYIQNRDPSKTAMEETVEHFTNVFSQEDPRFHPDTAGCIDRDWLGIGDLEIAAHYNPDDVADYIGNYPTSRACSQDGIHTSILRVLFRKGSRSVRILAGFFELCATTGLTPKRWNISLISTLR